MARLTKKEREAAIRFLSLIECSIATHGTPDCDIACELDADEIAGYNACCKMLGVAGYNGYKWWEA